jgi:glycerol-3-phosphate dehydrogenase subunit B
MAALKTIRCDLLVIGAGMAGMAAAMFAARHPLKTAQVGITGGIHFASGLLDVLGVHPQNRGVPWDDPWAGIARLASDAPRHPYARLGIGQIRAAMDECIALLTEAGLPYSIRGALNSRILTPAGTVKTTYAVPESMAAGVEALAGKLPTLLVDFQGLGGFSARQIAETAKAYWPGLRPMRIGFPGLDGELYAEQMARRLDLTGHRRRLAERIRPHIGRARAVGLPAVLGIYRTSEAVADLNRRLGVPVFEIPTMISAATGLRLREAFERKLDARGVTCLYQRRVIEAMVRPDDTFRFTVGGVGDGSPELRIIARGAVLASGRFFGGGLHAGRDRIRESIFDLPVSQPAKRSEWHRRDLFQPEGHPVNRAGLETDARFRPVDAGARVIHDRLHAAGSILAHQDWMRQKCGSGLSVATAYGAVNALADKLRNESSGG